MRAAITAVLSASRPRLGDGRLVRMGPEVGTQRQVAQGLGTALTPQG